MTVQAASARVAGPVGSGTGAVVCRTPLGQCQPFPASCPFRGFHHSVSGPRHIEPDRRISRITAHRGGVFHRGYGSV
jgi:hypothetical protein